MFEKIKHIPYRLLEARPSGCLKTPHDDRDFKTGIFGWFEYKPKYEKHVIVDYSIKDQRERNTCVFEATAGQKESDEKMELWVRDMVSYARRKGYISGNGFSNLRYGQLVLQDYGVRKYSSGVDPLNWDEYSNLELNYPEAEKHKIGSFWSVSNKNDIYKLLDENHVIATAIDWYTGFNQGGGFKAPWIINKKIGLKVGGHAFRIIGYDKDYNGQEVFIARNSYGKSWGDNGKFYITVNYLMDNNYGLYTNIDDIDKEVGKLLQNYDGKNVKSENSPAIWHIQNGKKKLYPDWLTYLSFDQKEQGFYTVESETLEKIEQYEDMDITKSKYWNFIKNVKKDNQLDKLLEIINEIK